ncbi:right-handed parallel beta-helix repeat-containing protein [Mucilaginibacter sp. JRF]|uniref:right-handed parallel beta-helix repeat-containing protein n=1 Tax=Mucilaginibacter sp. JRF TaxID=2780088 RepID=UPI00187DECA4|nr:right-handed parallel beta-helix repeat-containing protein [Mucilaginibacter sp. JRF]MBE9585349.1 right-handed parallel beta-helix repeat-containing protein [Mucilaginibacter sp. JRF]
MQTLKLIVLNLLFFSIATIQVVSAQTNNYYIAANGNDSNTGTSADKAFKTIGRLNKLVLKPGDVINFKRRDTFKGQLNIRQSGSATNPICIDAYGEGDKPIITGAIPVKNWTKQEGNVWKANVGDANGAINGVYIGNDDLPLGVYPNPEDGDGFLTIQSHTGHSQITSTEALNNNWAGGEVVIRKNAWELDKAAITNQSGNTLTVTDKGTAIADNWGFFIQNHPKTLDRSGEWYFDKAAKTLMLYYNTDPNSLGVTASVMGAGIILQNVSNISIQNIVIKQTQRFGISAKNVKGIKISNVGIYQIAQDALSFQGNGGDVTITNSVIDGALNNAIVIYDHKSITINNNTIKNIGLVAGRGNSGSGSYIAVRYNMKNGQAVISNNTIQNVGYSGIDFRSSNVTIKNNLIKNFGLTKTDGGGIYTFNGKTNGGYTNQKIISNIVLNGVSVKKGMYKSNSSAHGIYMDDCSQNVDIENNTVAECTGSGIFLHGTRNVSVGQNTCYNNANQLLVSYSNCGESTGNKILQNVFVGKKQQTVSRNVTRLLRSAVSLDPTNKQMSDDNNTRFEYNATGAAKTVTLDGTYRDADNKTYAGKVTLQPFSSVVLMK